MLLIPFILFGILSVVYWHYTESLGKGDLRPYIFVQFYPILTVPLITFLFPEGKPIGRYLMLVIGFYIVAKVLENADQKIFLLGQLISGHSLKHLAAAVAVSFVIPIAKKDSHEVSH